MLHPYYVYEEDKKRSDIVKLLIYTLLWCFILLFASSLVIGIVNVIIKQAFNFNVLEEASNSKYRLNYSYLKKIMIIGFLGPVIEEIIFRLYLNLNRIAVTISVGLMFYANIVSHILRSFQISETMFWSLRIIISLILSILVYTFVKQRLLDQIKIKGYRYLFYFSILLFGFLHLSNFASINPFMLLMSPLLVLPQLCYGIFIGFVRVKIKHGFYLGVLVHILINVIGNI